MRHDPDQSTLKPRKSARQARSADTVDVIVEAAARILETAGLPGFTTNSVAERAGVSVGSLYQYFPNKDAITRALIRRELELLETAVLAIDVTLIDPTPLRRFVAVAVDQQMRRPSLAQLLEIEEDRLAAGGDREPVRCRIADALSAILAAAGRRADRAVVQDLMALLETLVNAAASRGEKDAGRLVARADAIVEARLSVG